MRRSASSRPPEPSWLPGRPHQAPQRVQGRPLTQGMWGSIQQWPHHAGRDARRRLGAASSVCRYTRRAPCVVRPDRMGRKSAMAFPHRHQDQQPAVSYAGPAPASAPRPAVATPRCHLQSGSPIEGEHQLEKLEFALAVALTRGDLQRSRMLRDQIEALGGNREEPGT
jgi:hypothetical protein